MYSVKYKLTDDYYTTVGVSYTVQGAIELKERISAERGLPLENLFLFIHDEMIK